MSKPPKKTISLAEPAERPVTIAVSMAELHALLGHHSLMIKRINNTAGKAMVQAPTHREYEAIRKAHQELMDAHTNRAKGLNAILREHL